MDLLKQKFLDCKPPDSDEAQGSIMVGENNEGEDQLKQSARAALEAALDDGECVEGGDQLMQNARAALEAALDDGENEGGQKHKGLPQKILAWGRGRTATSQKSNLG